VTRHCHRYFPYKNILLEWSLEEVMTLPSYAMTGRATIAEFVRGQSSAAMGSSFGRTAKRRRLRFRAPADLRAAVPSRVLLLCKTCQLR